MACRRSHQVGWATARRRSVWLLVLVSSSGCAGAGAGGTSGDDPWLREMGFHERAQWPSSALHLGRGEIPRRERLSVILEQVPGVSVGRPQGEGWGIHREAEEGLQCDVAVFLNGALAARGRVGGQWTVDFLAPTADLDGIELHVGPDGPILDEGGCGVLLLWSEAEGAGPAIPLTGTVEGTFWGEGADAVTEVLLEPGGQRATFNRKGEFAISEVPAGSHWVVVRTAAGQVARERVRVYAFAGSWIDVPIGQEAAVPIHRRRAPPGASWPTSHPGIANLDFETPWPVSPVIGEGSG